MKSPGASVVSRTSARSCGVARSRRGRMTGKPMSCPIARSWFFAHGAQASSPGFSADCRRSRARPSYSSPMNRRIWKAAALGLISAAALLWACGTRTGLLVDQLFVELPDGAIQLPDGHVIHDAAHDV